MPSRCTSQLVPLTGSVATVRVFSYSRNRDSYVGVKSLLFAGRWCLTPDYRPVANSEFLESPWDDRAYFYERVANIDHKYEEILAHLASSLNEYHGASRSIRAWRILIGPWLRYLVQIFFDRLAVIQLLETKDDVQSFVSIPGPPIEELRAWDTEEFVNLAINSDVWNDALFDVILRALTSLTPIVTVDASIARHVAQEPYPRKRNPKTLVARVVRPFVRRLVAHSQYVLWDSRLPRLARVALEISKRQFPYGPLILRPETTPVLPSVAGKWLPRPQEIDDVDKLLWDLIESQIPCIFLEGFSNFHDKVEACGLPQQPTSIFTSNSFFCDEAFKFYTSSKIESGAQLVIAQHGGGYGVGKVIDTERHETLIADSFLSWGWRESCGRSSVVTPVGVLVSSKQRSAFATQSDGRMSLVMQNYPLRGYLLSSHPVADQWYSYFESNIEFVKALKSDYADRIRVKPYQEDYGRGQELLWRSNFPAVKFAESAKSFQWVERRSSLVIFGYNSTGILRGLNSKTPTIGFWEGNLWEHRESASVMIEDLRGVGILHNSGAEAARFLNSLSLEFHDWWNCREVVSVRKRVGQILAREPSSVLSSLKSAM